MSMNTTKIDYIEAIARYGSIARASEALFISSSALCKYVKGIEKENNIQLFDRVGKRFVLTYSGERYLHWLNSISSMYEEMDAELKDISNSSRGRIRIGVQRNLEMPILENVLPVLRESYPGAILDIYEDTSNKLKDLLNNNTLDIALLSDYNLGTSCNKIIIGKAHNVLVIPKNHRIKALSTVKESYPYPWIDLNEITNYPFTSPYPEQDAYRRYSDVIYNGLQLKITSHIRSLASELYCVARGDAFALSSDLLVKSTDYFKNLDLLSYDSETEEENLVIAYNKHHYMNSLTQKCIDLIKESYSAFV